MIEIENIIIAICLSVDRAIIFFISCSQFADILAYKAVIKDKIINNNIVIGWGYDIIRIIKKIPAVTSVDEWTNAEIGVGADIAIGNHAENGNWALFVHAAMVNINIVSNVNFLFILNSQFDEDIIILIDNKIIMSPIRFLSKVIEPDAADEWFW